MKLAADEPGMVGNFHNLHESVVRGRARNDQTRMSQLFAVLVVKFPAVTVPFVNQIFAVHVVGLCTGDELARIEA